MAMATDYAPADSENASSSGASTDRMSLPPGVQRHAVDDGRNHSAPAMPGLSCGGQRCGDPKAAASTTPDRQRHGHGGLRGIRRRLRSPRSPAADRDPRGGARHPYCWSRPGSPLRERRLLRNEAQGEVCRRAAPTWQLLQTSREMTTDVVPMRVTARRGLPHAPTAG